MSRSYQQTCPVARTLDIIGERWTMLIVRDLFLGHTKFSEFEQGSPRIPARVLSDRLKMLEGQGFIERVVYSEHPLRAEYRLTELGWTLGPVMESLFRWGIEHTLDARQRADLLDHLYGSPEPRAMRFPPPGRARKPSAAAKVR